MKILDNTLRDGEQMPGVVFNPEQKKDLVRRISDFGIDFIDLMPAISASETELTRELIEEGFCDKITASTMIRKDHIDLAYQIGVKSITLFAAVSDIHLEKKLGTNRKENLTNSQRIIDYAKSKDLSINFACEDASRANTSYLIDFINTIQDLVQYVFPCDTLGILTPKQTYEFIRKLKQETDCKIGLHVHNDFGQATANTLAGIEAGADLFSGTFTGIGERAGNAPLEEVVMALRHQYNTELPVSYESLGSLCDLVQQYSQVELQKHKPISGENAFSHESGVHVDGVLKHPLNYENFDPQTIGVQRRILFGKHSGAASLRYLLDGQYSKEQYAEILEQIKSKAESEKTSFSEQQVMEMLRLNKITV